MYPGGGAHLQVVPSLRFPSSSSEAFLLTARLVFLETAREFAAELALELAPEAMRERALRETVLPLSSTWRRRSGMMVSVACRVRLWWGG